MSKDLSFLLSETMDDSTYVRHPVNFSVIMVLGES